MFSDLVGSTALSARMDPEDLREVISAYQKCVAETVRRFGGFVANYMGDGVLVYFGYPEAHEDDAERAVRAGLELVAAVTELKTHALAANPCRHSDRPCRRWRPDRIGRGTGKRDSGRDTEPCSAPAERLPSLTPSSLLRARESCSATCLSLRTSEQRTSKALRDQCGLGLRCDRAWWKAGSKHSMRAALPSLSDEKKNSNSCYDAGPKRRAAKDRWCCCLEKPVSASLGLTAALLEWLAPEPHTRLRYLCSPQHTDSALLSDHQPNGACRRIYARRYRASET